MNILREVYYIFEKIVFVISYELFFIYFRLFKYQFVHHLPSACPYNISFFRKKLTAKFAKFITDNRCSNRCFTLGDLLRGFNQTSRKSFYLRNRTYKKVMSIGAGCFVETIYLKKVGIFFLLLSINHKI